MTSISTSSSGSSTSERSNNMCGDTGVSNNARCFGDTTGPRADSEYAVEPVGVAMINPSAAYEVNAAPSIRTSRRTVWPASCFSTTASFKAVHVSVCVGADAAQGRVEHHPLLDPPLAGFRAGSPTLERRRERRRLDLGEIAEQADVDADDRDAGVTAAS